MKKARKITALILCVLFAFFSLAMSSSAAGEKFVVLGDSIAEGIDGIGGDTSKSYAVLVAEEKGYELFNFASGGYNSSHLLSQVRNNAEVRAAIAGADIISISIGGNDFLNADNLITVMFRILVGDNSLAEEHIETIRANYNAAMDIIIGLNPDALIIVQTLYNPFYGVPVFGDVYDTGVSLLNACFYDYLAEHAGAYKIADVYGAFKGREGLVYDDFVHPSVAGHAVIARVVAYTIDGVTTELPPVENVNLNIFQKIAVFISTLFAYLKYALSIMSLWEVIMVLYNRV